MVAACVINISYTHLFIEKDDIASIYMELEDVRSGKSHKKYIET